MKEVIFPECADPRDLGYLSDNKVVENIANLFMHSTDGKSYHKVIATRAKDSQGYRSYWNLTLYYYLNPPTYPNLKWKDFENISSIIANNTDKSILAFVIARDDAGILYASYHDLDVLKTSYSGFEIPVCAGV